MNRDKKRSIGRKIDIVKRFINNLLLYILFIGVLHSTFSLLGQTWLENMRRERIRCVEQIRNVESELILLKRRLDTAMDVSGIEKWAELKNYHIILGSKQNIKPQNVDATKLTDKKESAISIDVE